MVQGRRSRRGSQPGRPGARRAWVSRGCAPTGPASGGAAARRQRQLGAPPSLWWWCPCPGAVPRPAGSCRARPEGSDEWAGGGGFRFATENGQVCYQLSCQHAGAGGPPRQAAHPPPPASRQARQQVGQSASGSCLSLTSRCSSSRVISSSAYRHLAEPFPTGGQGWQGWSGCCGGSPSPPPPPPRPPCRDGPPPRRRAAPPPPPAGACAGRASSRRPLPADAWPPEGDAGSAAPSALLFPTPAAPGLASVTPALRAACAGAVPRARRLPLRPLAPERLRLRGSGAGGRSLPARLLACCGGCGGDCSCCAGGSGCCFTSGTAETTATAAAAAAVAAGW